MTEQEANLRANREDLETIAARKLGQYGLAYLVVPAEDQDTQRFAQRLVRAARGVPSDLAVIPVSGPEAVLEATAAQGAAGLVPMQLTPYDVRGEKIIFNHINTEACRDAGLTPVSRLEFKTERGVLMAEVLASVEDLHDKPDKVRARGNERFPVNMTDLSTKNPNHDPLINEVLVYPASVPDVQATRLLMLREHGDEVPAMAHVLQGVSPHPQEMSTIVTAGHHHEVNLR